MKPIEQAIELADQQYLSMGLSAQRRYPNEALIRFLASRYFSLTMTERKSIRLLEVGCGSGANLWMMAKEGFVTHGMDSSAKGLDLARQHLGEKWGVTADLRQGSFTELPYENDYFDAVVDVVSLLTLNLKDSRLALSEIARVLKPGGAFFSYRLSDASVMYQSSGGNWIDAVTVDNIADSSMPLSDNGPMSFWSPSLARVMYSEIGLDLVSVERQGRTYENGGKYVEYLVITADKSPR
jgi:SAM-dependent methyltransferase